MTARTPTREPVMSRSAPGGYRDLPRLAGPAFLPLAFAARLPAAMMPIGTLTLVAIARDSYTAGGIASGLCGLGSALGGPVLGAVVDRFGQRRPLQAVALLSAAAMLVFVALTVAGAPLAVVAAAAFVIGVTNPLVGVMARGRWMHLSGPGAPADWSAVRRSRTLHAALGWESMADESSFVLGPILVSVLTLAVAGTAPLLGAAVLTAVLVVWVARHPTGRAVSVPAAAGQRRPAPLTALVVPAVLAPVLGAISLGSVFGSTLTTVTAFAGALGDEGLGGLLYAAMGVTSAIAALASGMLTERVPLSARWLASGLIIAAAALPLLMARETVVVLGALATMGVGVGPLVVTLFAVAHRVSPAGRSALVLTLMSSGIMVGQSMSASLAGVVVDRAPLPGAFGAVAVCAASTPVVALLGLVELRRRAAAEGFAV